VQSPETGAVSDQARGGGTLSVAVALNDPYQTVLAARVRPDGRSA
jgi:hypothetical protein